MVASHQKMSDFEVNQISGFNSHPVVGFVIYMATTVLVLKYLRFRVQNSGRLGR